MADIINFQEEMHRRNAPDNKHVFTDENGDNWYEYSYEYEHKGKRYGYSLWALNHKDAEDTLAAMSNGKITGQIFWEG